jgi:hypothetical protein
MRAQAVPDTYARRGGEAMSMPTAVKIAVARYDLNDLIVSGRLAHGEIIMRALAAYERVEALLESKADQWEDHMRSTTADELRHALEGK